MENFQLEPDIRAALPYDALINGKDTQIEAAVKEMLRVIGEGGSRKSSAHRLPPSPKASEWGRCGATQPECSI